MSSSQNRNPTGKNQYGKRIPDDDPELIRALTTYHGRLITNNKRISELLLQEHNIKLSPKSVERRRKKYGLLGSTANERTLGSSTQIQQIVLDAMATNPSGQMGPQQIRHRIARTTGNHLRRDTVRNVMRTHDPDGFIKRAPGANRIKRTKKTPLGINDRWSGDGHDKLYGIGFPIWAIVDDATGKWLGGWVVPSNRLADIVGYLFLCVVENCGGIPNQMTTDCGTETTVVFGLVNALREICHPDFDPGDELPAHVYVRSVHNISIERSWFRLRLGWGLDAVSTFEQGIDQGIYDSNKPHQFELCQWLWHKLLQETLDEFMEEHNSFRSRRDNNKAGPSGISRHEAYSLPHLWGGKDCLMPIDMSVVQAIKDEMGGDDLIRFVSKEFSERCECAYTTLGISKLTFQNVWVIFRQLLPLVFPEL